MTEQHNPNAVSRELTLGFAQRKSNLFFAWFAPLALALAGALYALPALLAEDTQDTETGVVMMVVGLVLSGLGWLLSTPKRFSKKKLKPAVDIPRIDQAIRIHRPTRILNLVVLSVVLIGLSLSPKGLSQDIISIAGLFIGFYVMIMIGLECSHRWLKNSGRYYDEWLRKQ